MSKGPGSNVGTLRRSGLVFAAGLAVTLMGGCGSDPAAPDRPDVAGGGQERILDFEQFRTAVAPVLMARGCDAGGDCHGGGIRGSFELSPQSDKDLQFDFEQAVLQIDDLDPIESALLLKPLAEDQGGDPHGFTAFSSTSDPGYAAILAWIEAGELRP